MEKTQNSFNVQSQPQEIKPFAFAAQMDSLHPEDVEMMAAGENALNPFSLGAATISNPFQSGPGLFGNQSNCGFSLMPEFKSKKNIIKDGNGNTII